MNNTRNSPGATGEGVSPGTSHRRRAWLGLIERYDGLTKDGAMMLLDELSKYDDLEEWKRQSLIEISMVAAPPPMMLCPGCQHMPKLPEVPA